MNSNFDRKFSKIRDKCKGLSEKICRVFGKTMAEPKIYHLGGVGVSSCDGANMHKSMLKKAIVLQKCKQACLQSLNGPYCQSLFFISNCGTSCNGKIYDECYN